MDLDSLRIFAKVAENLSFTEAAKELGIEKSNVSMKIAALESRLGTRLLNRSTRSVALSEAGERYYQYCKQIVNNALEADAYIKSLSDAPQGILRIAGPNGIGRILFKDILGKFLKEHPSIDVQIHLDNREVDLLRERFDIALRPCRITPKSSTLTAEHIFKIELGFWVSPQYISEHGEITSPEQLTEHSFIFSGEPLDELVLYQNTKKFGMHPKCRVAINNMDACVHAIQNGLGIGILPVTAVRHELMDGSVQQILADCKVPSLDLYAIYPNAQWQSPKLTKFLEFLQEWRKNYI